MAARNRPLDRPASQHSINRCSVLHRAGEGVDLSGTLPGTALLLVHAWRILSSVVDRCRRLRGNRRHPFAPRRFHHRNARGDCGSADRAPNPTAPRDVYGIIFRRLRKHTLVLSSLGEGTALVASRFDVLLGQLTSGIHRWPCHVRRIYRPGSRRDPVFENPRSCSTTTATRCPVVRTYRSRHSSQSVGSAHLCCYSTAE